jgi:hypothetical protein
LEEQKRLERSEEETEEVLIQAQQTASEAAAKLARLRRQKRMLITRGSDMVRRGLQSLDELEELEGADRQELGAVVPVNDVFGEVDWGAVDFSSLGPEPADPDSSGGTVVRDIDNVSNS